VERNHGCHGPKEKEARTYTANMVQTVPRYNTKPDFKVRIELIRMHFEL